MIHKCTWRLAALGVVLLTGCGGLREALTSQEPSRNPEIQQFTMRRVTLVAIDTLRGVACYSREYYVQALSCVKVKP